MWPCRVPAPCSIPGQLSLVIVLGALPALAPQDQGGDVGISVSSPDHGPGEGRALGLPFVPSSQQRPGIERGLVVIRRPGYLDPSNPSASQSPSALRFPSCGASAILWELALLVLLCHGANMDTSLGGQVRCSLAPGLGAQRATWQLPGRMMPCSHPSPERRHSLADCTHTSVSLIYVLLCLRLQ